MRPPRALAAALLVALLAAAARAGTPVPGWTDKAYVTGLVAPTAIAFLPDGRLLVNEKGGTLQVFDGSSVRSVATFAVCTTGEEGLLGLAVDPRFAENGFLYFYRTVSESGTCVNQVVKAALQVDGTLGAPTVLLDGISTNSLGNGEHNGGGLRIGPADGKLYVSVGDTELGDNQGGPGSSTNPYAQDRTSLNGKFLRLNLDGSIPADNPYVGNQSGYRPEIFAYGFRNPWRFGFDPQTSKLWAGDVGDSTWEEIDIVVAGGDYGWPACEGLSPQGCNPHTNSLVFVDPILTYPHGGSGLEGEAVIGGAFAPATGPFATAGFGGDYFFADLGEPGNLTEGTLWHGVPTAGRDALVGNTADMIVGAAANPVDVIFGPDGALYYVAITSGEVRRVLPASAGTTTTTPTTSTTTTTTTSTTTTTTHPTTTTTSSTTTTTRPTTTTTTSTTTTTTTTLPPCTRAPDDPDAARCVIGLLRATLADVTPGCARRCRCNLGPRLDALASLLDGATAAKARGCKRRLRTAVAAAARLRRRASALAARGCAGPSLASEAALLGDRLHDLLASGYCAAR
ncbi:MAG TPA: PQQ-dependent sugar dehydrogenase [Candidatus Binatia bacterium]|nr:PQQ-dependent sugar dehydrogenase [Candidatus Binatia bacterium]